MSAGLMHSTQTSHQIVNDGVQCIEGVGAQVMIEIVAGNATTQHTSHIAEALFDVQAVNRRNNLITDSQADHGRIHAATGNDQYRSITAIRWC
jgi:hypothetical protein